MRYSVLYSAATQQSILNSLLIEFNYTTLFNIHISQSVQGGRGAEKPESTLTIHHFKPS